MSSDSSADARTGAVRLVLLPVRLAAAIIVAAVCTTPARAQSPAPPVTVGGVVQVDYETATAGATTRDRAFFRRLLLSVQVAAKDWMGQIQIDVAPSLLGERVSVRGAYLRYLGLAAHGLTLTIGNQKPPFSRVALAPASRRGLIERNAAGERTNHDRPVRRRRWRSTTAANGRSGTKGTRISRIARISERGSAPPRITIVRERTPVAVHHGRKRHFKTRGHGARACT